jgi:hypothetical protein
MTIKLNPGYLYLTLVLLTGEIFIGVYTLDA